MFDNLNLRNKFLVAVAVPVNVLAVLALWSVAAGQYPLGAVALMGGAATMTVAYRLAEDVGARAAALSAQAAELAAVRLPGVLADLTRPLGDGPAGTGSHQTDGDRPDGEPADINAGSTPAVTGTDELGQLGETLTLIETQARTAVDQERATISRNLGSMVKNLARRNQSLLDRQIEHIDWLEAKEQDPERLEQLFKLDHLATRMRRTSESVLVLGGAEPTRQRGGPAPIADVLRVAMGETEDYRNIRLRTVDEVKIAGGPAFDLAHLLAEVLENATQFSPPESPVELHAVSLGADGYQVTVVDRGVGMDQRQLDEANAVVADPPDISLSIGHAVGFIVVGRLARRLGATVELSATAGSGVTVQVRLPVSALVGAPAATAAPAAPADRPTGTGAPLDRLLAVDTSQLPEGEGWQAPKVDQRKAKPLRARDGATAAVPDSLKPAAAQSPAPDTAPEAEPEAEPASAAEAAFEVVERPLPSRAERPTPPPSKRPRPERGQRQRGARTLAEAIPTGAAFESGVERLLTDDEPGDGGAATGGNPAAERPTPTGTPVDPNGPWVPPTTGADAGGSLARRQKGASAAPAAKGQGARASSRKPDEIRSMITRYRDGLKGTGTGPTPAGSIVPDTPPPVAEIGDDILHAAEAALRSVTSEPAELADEPTTPGPVDPPTRSGGTAGKTAARNRRRDGNGNGNGSSPAGEEK